MGGICDKKCCLAMQVDNAARLTQKRKFREEKIIPDNR